VQEQQSMTQEHDAYLYLAMHYPVIPNEYINPTSLTSRIIESHGVFMWWHQHRRDPRIQAWVKVYAKIALILPH